MKAAEAIEAFGRYLIVHSEELIKDRTKLSIKLILNTNDLPKMATEYEEYFFEDESVKKYEVEMYHKLWEKYGEQAQLVVALEELSEAQKEICKHMRGKSNDDELAEELADAGIMIEQTLYVLGLKTKYFNYRNLKLERIERLVYEEEGMVDE